MAKDKKFKQYELPFPPEAFINAIAQQALAQGSIIAPIKVDSSVIESGAYKKGISGWRLNADGSIEALDATIVGKITATTGAIGGFTIGSTTLSVTVGGNTTALSSSTNAFIAGPTGAPTVTITRAGIIYATGAIIDGTSTIGGTLVSIVLTDISGNTSSITQNATDIATNVTDISGNTSSITQNATNIATNVTDISGNTSSIAQNATNINLRVEKNDVINQINISNEGILIAGDNISLDGDTTVVGTFSVTTGTIAGLYVTTTTLANSATANNANVLIDTANSLIRLGPTSGDYLTLDGVNKKVESSNYVSGVFGAGFHLDSDLLEVGNIAARGLIRTAVFQRDVISTVGGNLAVLDGDVLDEDMLADD